jgi:ERCC4-related helicase
VRQQIEACHDVVGIPEREIAHLDGNIPADRRHGNLTLQTIDHKNLFSPTPTISNFVIMTTV